MRELPRDDDKLISLVGATIASTRYASASFSVEAPLGFGPVSVVFYGSLQRRGAVPVVLKIMRPSFVHRFGPVARHSAMHEVDVLHRLDQAVPPSPFIVRLVDDGVMPVRYRDEPLDLPWIAVEYVYGGGLGTTLAQRVESSVANTRFAFGPLRAGAAIDCLTGGLAAIHDLGEVHRGVAPNKVLCSGGLGDETLKLADLGVVKPRNWMGGALPLGMPGFVAPELVEGNEDDVGPWTDTFALGALLFFMLTGERMFPSHAMDAAEQAIREPTRRSIRECPALAPELREREHACKSIDFILGWATSAEPSGRIAEVHALSAMLAPHLRSESLIPPPSINDPEPTFDGGTRADAWTFRRMREAGDVGVIRSVAWDGSGRCLAATNEGLFFWDGTRFIAAETKGIPDPTGIRFVRRIAPGRWLMGGDQSMLAIYTTGGVTRLVQTPGESMRFERLSGALDDVAVLVAVPADGPPLLNTFLGKRWMRPFPLTDVAFVGGIAQLSDARWLVAGRALDGSSYAAIFSPLSFTLDRIASPAASAFTACVAHPRLGIGIAVSSAGQVLWYDAAATRIESVGGAPSLSVGRVDNAGRGWVASAGQIWMRDVVGGAAPPDAAWSPIFFSDEWTAPFVSLFAEEGLILAITADGAILEGRSEMDEEARASSRQFV